jgi:hypothetical protein
VNSCDHTTELRDAVTELCHEVRYLAETLDQIREALQWQNNNAADYPHLIHDRENFWQAVHATLPPWTSHLASAPHEPLTNSQDELPINSPGRQHLLFGEGDE